MRHREFFIEKSRDAGDLILLLNDAMDPLEHRNDPPRSSWSNGETVYRLVEMVHFKRLLQGSKNSFCF